MFKRRRHTHFQQLLIARGYKKFIERKALEESDYLKDDCFRVRCHVTVYKEIRTEVTSQFVTVPPSTTGNSSFAVCHEHSAKPEKHSAKGFPSVTLGKEHTVATVLANSVFAECYTRQTLCRVFFGLCRVSVAHGKTTVSGSECFSFS